MLGTAEWWYERDAIIGAGVFFVFCPRWWWWGNVEAQCYARAQYYAVGHAGTKTVTVPVLHQLRPVLLLLTRASI